MPLWAVTVKQTKNASAIEEVEPLGILQGLDSLISVELFGILAGRNVSVENRQSM
jgi:hypothetical protein